MKFVMLKGMEGFGDRLQTLLQAIRYATVTKRTLIIDWRDNNWAGSTQINADYYFKLNTLPNFNLESFSIYYQHQGSELTVFPTAWKNYVLERPDESFIYKDIFQIDPEDLIWQICQWEREDLIEDIVILPGVRKRSWRYSDFASISFAPWILQNLKKYGADNDIRYRSYNCVHLRAGSKSWAGGNPGTHPNYSEMIKTKFPDCDSYLANVFSDFNEKKLGEKKLRTLVLSDSKWLSDVWIDTYGIGESIDNTLDVDFRGATNVMKLDDRELSTKGLERTLLNFLAIRDFHLLLNANLIAHDGVSLFSTMADRIRTDADNYFKFNS
ncbi:MAG: hypothetical protein VW352_06900 [Gammaproteobacteria bacterium]